MRLVLFAGKGGVGKTTTAAATAVHARRCGLRVLVVSTDAAHSLGDALGARLGACVSEVEPGLGAQQIDPRTRLRGAAGEAIAAALESLGVDAPASSELAVLPAVDELLALLTVADHRRTGEWDVVLLDGAATAQTLRLLTLPDTLRRLVDRLLPIERRLDRVLDATPAAPVSGVPEPRDHLVESADRLLVLLRGVHSTLTDPSTSVRLVVTPESVVAAESRRTWTALAMHGYAVDAVVANRVVPTGGDDPWRRAWNASQARVLDQLRESFAPTPVLTAGYAATEPVGVAALAALGEELYGPARPGETEWLISPSPCPPPVRVERDGTDFLLDLDLPLAAREDVELTRRGAELTVGVGAGRRVVDLPSALQRCDVVGASLRGGLLRVRFTPDPALWRAF